MHQKRIQQMRQQKIKPIKIGGTYEKVRIKNTRIYNSNGWSLDILSCNVVDQSCYFKNSVLKYLQIFQKRGKRRVSSNVLEREKEQTC